MCIPTPIYTHILHPSSSAIYHPSILTPFYNIMNPAPTAITRTVPNAAAPLTAALFELGILFVAAPPKYQLPISVNFPFEVNMAALGPTLLTSLLNDPKYEYLSM